MNRSTSKDDHFTDVLAEFSTTFGSRSSKYSNVRCISKAALIKELLNLRSRLTHPTAKATSGQALLERLVKSGLVHPVALTDTDRGQSADRFFSIGLNETNSELEPIELLQAMVPEGAICYFTAVHIHELSTQIPTHHHIARIVDATPRPGKPRNDAPLPRPTSIAPFSKEGSTWTAAVPLSRHPLLHNDSGAKTHTRHPEAFLHKQDRVFRHHLRADTARHP